jgi:polar amino acid transport system substrate-binding protein
LGVIVIGCSAAAPSAAPATTAAAATATPAAATATPVPATSAPAETTLTRIKRDGFIRVGFANENPYAYADANGNLTGEAPEVLRYVMQQQGVPALEGVLTEFSALIPGLTAKRIDAAAAGMSLTVKRCQQVLFGDPEYTNGEGFIVKKGNPKNLHSYKDVAANPASKLIVGNASVQKEYAAAAGVKPEQLVELADLPTMMAALQGDRGDAVAVNELAIAGMIERTGDPSLEQALPFTDPVDKDGKTVRNYGATAFRMEDRDLRDAYSTELKKMRESGKLLEILKPFGFTEANVPAAEATAEKLCKG